LNTLSYLATEVHPGIGGLFYPSSEEVKAFKLGNANKKLDYLNTHVLVDKKFIFGDKFTVADAYLYIILSWTAYVGIDLSGYPQVQAYAEGIKNLETVQAAHARIATNPSSTL
jgi:glutathione S-transferase